MGRVQNGWIVTSPELKAQRKRALAKRAAETRIDSLALEDHLANCRREAENRGEKFTVKDGKKAADDFIARTRSEK